MKCVVKVRTVSARKDLPNVDSYFVLKFLKEPQEACKDILSGAMNSEVCTIFQWI